MRQTVERWYFKLIGVEATIRKLRAERAELILQALEDGYTVSMVHDEVMFTKAPPKSSTC